MRMPLFVPPVARCFHNCSSNIDKIIQLSNEYKCILIQNNNNKGIAYALNQIMKIANFKHYHWAITLDQDTICSTDLINGLVNYCRSDVGIVAPSIKDRNVSTNKKIVSNKKAVVKNWVISSASLTNVDAWISVGGFDEKLFIDGVDIDFGYNLKIHGYKVIQVQNEVISHAVGEIHEHMIGPIVVRTKNHSAFRKYYIVRNIIILEKKYHYEGIIKSALKILKQLLLVVIFEKHKKTKLLAMIKGIKDGVKC